MALGTTNIALRAVRTLLGYVADWSLFNICTSVLINRWSKYKPIRDAGLGANWPAGAGSNYGLNLVNGSLVANWDYLQPQGGSWGGGIDEPGRLGDFRGYEHDGTLTYPPVYTEDTGPTDIYPSGTPYSHNFSPVPVFNSVSSVRIRTSDLALDGYYLGMELGLPGGPWYKTGVQINTTGNQAISFSCEMTDPVTPAFSNCPYGIGDDITWALIISSQQKVNWSAVAPATFYYLPVGTYGGKVMLTNGTFDINDWIAITQGGVQDYTMSFTPAGGDQWCTVLCSYDGGPPDWAVTAHDAWLAHDEYATEGGVHIAANLVVSGNAIKVTASAIADVSTVTCVSGEGTWANTDSGTSHAHPTLTRADGTMTVTSNGVSKDITVQQGLAGTDVISWQFKPDDLGGFPPGDTDVDVVITRGVDVVYSNMTGAFHGRANVMSALYDTVISEVCHNDTYIVTITIH